jgi:hypothetical protein
MPRPSPLPPRRFPGDGFDYRRPVMSTNTRQLTAQTSTPTPDVIDLTSDSDTTLTAAALTRRASSERRTPRPHQVPSRRQADLSRPRPHNARSSDLDVDLDLQMSRAPLIDLEALVTDTVEPTIDRTEEEMNNDEELLALFRDPTSSPGFEITGERTVGPHPPRRRVSERRPTPYVPDQERDRSDPPQLPPTIFQNLPHGLANWFARAGSQPGVGDTVGRREQNIPLERGSTNIFSYTNGVFPSAPNQDRRNPRHPHGQHQLPRLPALDTFPPPRLNYEAQGFELIGTARSSSPPRATSPYKAPKAPAPGFTRKIEEDDIVVCPHCGDELGTGDSDLKQQIWVVKQCGHVSLSCEPIPCTIGLTNIA